MDKQKTIDITGRLGRPSPAGRATAQHARSEGTHYGKDRLGISTDEVDAPAPAPARPALQPYTPDMCPTSAQRQTVPTGQQDDTHSDLAAVPAGNARPGRKRIVVLLVAGAVVLGAAWGLWSWLGGSSSTPRRAAAAPARPAAPASPVAPPKPASPAAVKIAPKPPTPAPAVRPPSPPRPAPRRAKAWLAPSRRPGATPKPRPGVLPPARPAPGERPKPATVKPPKPPKGDAPPKASDDAPAPKPPGKPGKRFRPAPAGLTLGGVASFGDQKFADINGKLLTVGDTINGATLVTVGDMHVEMEIDGEYFHVEVGGASTPNGQEGTDTSEKTPDEPK